MNHLIEKFSRYVATLGPVGFIPFAPGTMASLCAIPLYIWYRHALVKYSINETAATMLLLIITFWIISAAKNTFREQDPDPIVMDEVIGIFITLYHFPPHPVFIAIGFFYFRFFDILKPLGIESLQQLSGAWGILADDVAAALLSNLALYYTIRLLF
ncbi:MAG: phosphatidylglycerophosphatase A [Candidatus Babeliaceae bacterium]|nr:phosphatidylglycerophosphatase A [Candidatus Babeliaceae bacterium]